MTRTVLALLFRLVADTLVLVSDEGHVEAADGNGTLTHADAFPVWTCVREISSEISAAQESDKVPAAMMLAWNEQHWPGLDAKV